MSLSMPPLWSTLPVPAVLLVPVPPPRCTRSLHPFPRRRALPLLYRPAEVPLIIVVPLMDEQLLQEGHQLSSLVLVGAGQVDVLCID